MPKQQQNIPLADTIQANNDPCGCKTKFNIAVGDPPGNRFFEGCHKTWPGLDGCKCTPSDPTRGATDTDKCLWDPIGYRAPLPLPNDLFPSTYPDVGNPSAARCAGIIKNNRIKYTDDSGKEIELWPTETVWPQNVAKPVTKDRPGFEYACMAWRGCIMRAWKELQRCQKRCVTLPGGGGVQVPTIPNTQL